MHVEDEDPIVALVGDEQAVFIGVERDPVGPRQSIRSETALAALEVGLPDHQRGVWVVRQTPRVDVEDQNPRAILDKQPLIRLVDDDFGATELLPAAALDHRVEVGLPDDVGRFRIVLHPVGMDVKDQDPATVADEEPLIDVVDGQAGFGAARAVRPIRDRLTPAAEEASVPDNVIGRVPDMPAVFVELVDEYPDIAGLRDEHPMIDAIQRHRARSPNAVRVRSVVGHPTAWRRVPPRVELEQHIARRLAGLLRPDRVGRHSQRHHCQRGRECPSSNAHGVSSAPRISRTVSCTSAPDGLW